MEEKSIINSQRTLTVSEACKRVLIEHYNSLNEKNVNAIYNGIDTDLFSQTHVPRNQDKAIFTYVGRNDPEKGIFLLLQSFRDLKDEDGEENFELRLVTTNESSLQRAIKRFDLSDHVIFSGWKSPKELPKIYSSTTFTVIPSYWESFSYVTAESLSCGTPVITSSAGALPEIVDHDVGLLFPVGDTKGLTEQARKACSYSCEHIRKMGGNGREKAQTYFTKETFLENYLKFIRKYI